MTTATSAAAMARHVHTHLENKFIKIGRIKTRSGKSEFRPEEHTWKDSTGKYYHGSDARIEKIIEPRDSKIVNGFLLCPRCNMRTCRYDKEMKTQKSGS